MAIKIVQQCARHGASNGKIILSCCYHCPLPCVWLVTSLLDQEFPRPAMGQALEKRERERHSNVKISDWKEIQVTFNTFIYVTLFTKWLFMRPEPPFALLSLLNQMLFMSSLMVFKARRKNQIHLQIRHSLLGPLHVQFQTWEHFLPREVWSGPSGRFFLLCGRREQKSWSRTTESKKGNSVHHKSHHSQNIPT